MLRWLVPPMAVLGLILSGLLLATDVSAQALKADCIQYAEKDRYESGDEVALEGVKIGMGRGSAQEALACRGFTITPEAMATTVGVENFSTKPYQNTFQKTLTDGTIVSAKVVGMPPRGTPPGGDFSSKVELVQIGYRLSGRLKAPEWQRIRSDSKNTFRGKHMVETDEVIFRTFKYDGRKITWRINGQDYRDGSVSGYSITISGTNSAKIDIDKLIRDATAGDLEAQVYLANHYRNTNKRQAVRWSQAAAAQGDAGAQFMLSDLYARGLGGLQKNKTEAANLLSKAAAQGHVWAQFNLGNYYFEGTGVERNHATAAHWYETAISQYKGSQNPTFYRLGRIYRAGSGGKQDYAIARGWFERAELHPPASYQLGLMYQFGEGVAVDMSKAAEYYAAVEDGVYDITGADSNIRTNGGSIETAAKTALAYLYYKGLGVTQDQNKAYELYKVAGSRGNIIAQHNLGVIYGSDEVAKRDYAQSEQWFTRAGEAGYLESQLALGHFYYQNQVVPRDPVKATHWFELAAKQGSRDADAMLAQIRSELTARSTVPARNERAAQKPVWKADPNPDTFEQVVGGLAVLAAWFVIKDAISDNSSSNTPTPTSEHSSVVAEAVREAVAECRKEVYPTIYRCYTHGANCPLAGACTYDWNCQTGYGGRGQCRRYRGWSYDIEDVFCDPKNGLGFRTEEEVLANSCR